MMTMIKVMVAHIALRHAEAMEAAAAQRQAAVMWLHLTGEQGEEMEVALTAASESSAAAAAVADKATEAFLAAYDEAAKDGNFKQRWERQLRWEREGE